ncbi:uncharacterized protein METZ01_LOCUS331685, partial [marine metagenome]
RAEVGGNHLQGRQPDFHKEMGRRRQTEV